MPQFLRFVPRADLIVRVPNAVQITGQAPPYLGRTKRQMPDGTWGYPASQTPYEVEAGSDEAKRAIALARRDESLWPYDEATAAACDTKFVAVEWVDGEWVPVKPAKLKKVANEG